MHEVGLNIEPNFYVNLLSQFPGLIVVGNLESQCIYTNRYTANLFGYPDETSMLGISPFDMRCPAVESAEEFYDQNMEVIKTENELTMIDIHTYVNGQAKILLTKKTPYRENKLIAGSICYCTELNSDTLRKICSELIKSDKKFRDNSDGEERSYRVISPSDRRRFSDREHECMFHLIRGKTMKEIAKELNISPRTVETYLEQIKEKLRCQTRSQIVEFCLAEGYINYIPHSLFSTNLSGIIHAAACGST